MLFPPSQFFPPLNSFTYGILKIGFEICEFASVFLNILVYHFIRFHI